MAARLISEEDKDLCRTDCGFYGSDATEGYCSKCFKEVLLKRRETGKNYNIGVWVPKTQIPATKDVELPLAPTRSFVVKPVRSEDVMGVPEQTETKSPLMSEIFEGKREQKEVIPSEIAADALKSNNDQAKPSMIVGESSIKEDDDKNGIAQACGEKTSIGMWDPERQVPALKDVKVPLFTKLYSVTKPLPSEDVEEVSEQTETNNSPISKILQSAKQNKEIVPSEAADALMSNNDKAEPAHIIGKHSGIKEDGNEDGIVMACSSKDITQQAETSKQGTTKNRCGVCRRKLRITDFECRCGKRFCGLHRYSDKHDCTFDYREHAAQKIKTDNPVIKAKKIRKL